MTRLMRLRGVVEQVGMSRRWVYAKVRAGQFPSPVHIDGNTFWVASEVEAWVTAKIAAARADHGGERGSGFGMEPRCGHTTSKERVQQVPAAFAASSPRPARPL